MQVLLDDVHLVLKSRAEYNYNLHKLSALSGKKSSLAELVTKWKAHQRQEAVDRGEVQEEEEKKDKKSTFM